MEYQKLAIAGEVGSGKTQLISTLRRYGIRLVWCTRPGAIFVSLGYGEHKSMGTSYSY